MRNVLAGNYGCGWWGWGCWTRFPMYKEGATVSRTLEEVDETGPAMDFIDVKPLPLKTPEVRLFDRHKTLVLGGS